MAHSSNRLGWNQAYWGLLLLAIVTLVEVAFSLFGKGHILGGVKESLAGTGLTIFLVVIGLILIVLSLYKAYFIVYEFMHMRYEHRGLALTVLLPMLLLVWAIIAFFQEGDSWQDRREDIEYRNMQDTENSITPQQGFIYPLEAIEERSEG